MISKTRTPYLRNAIDGELIDWHEWGPAAFNLAQNRNVPVLISSGFATAYWCAAMSYESCRDEEIAAFINEHFVPIKVDRQERPDVDAFLTSAAAAITGQTGWPLTIFATSTGQPFFAGTYFGRERVGNQPGFLEVCQTIAEVFANRREEVFASAAQITAHIADFQRIISAPVPKIWPILEEISSEFDLLHGGFGAEPKFPQPTLLDALLVKGEPGCLDMAQRTAESMARGAIFDQVGGGFHRYAIDAAWTVPSFEKLLADNALLLSTYLRTWRRTADHDGSLRSLFERVVFTTAEWLLRELRLESGVFAAGLHASSADIRGVAHEGAYYLWNRELLIDALGSDDGEWATRSFHATDELAPLVLTGRIDFDRLAVVMPKLTAARGNRFAPGVDESVVAAWNGYAISALTTAALIFNEPDWLEAAQTAAESIWQIHFVAGQLYRVSVDGQVTDAPGTAEDYAALADAFTELGGAVGDDIWLERAITLLEIADDRFSADDGGFFDGADPVLVVRPRSLTDGPTPNPTAALVAAYYTVGVAADRPDFIDRARTALVTLSVAVEQYPRQSGAALTQFLVEDEARTGLGRAKVVVAGEPVSELARAAWRMAPAGSVISVSGPISSESITAKIWRSGTLLTADTVAELRTALWARA